MRKILAFLRISIVDTFSYRGDVLLITLSSLTMPLVYLAIWLALIASGGNSPLTRAEFIQYYLLSTIVGLWVAAWSSSFIATDIRLGRISPYLLKPAPFILVQLGNNLGEKILKSLYAIPVVLFLSSFFHVTVPALSPFQWLAFAISWIMSAALVFTVDVIIGIFSFWLDDTSSVDEAYDFFLYLLSGRIVPLFVFPASILSVVNLLPFRYTLSLPIEIFLKKISPDQIPPSLFIQFFWLMIALVVYNKLWKTGLKKYAASGA